MFNVRSNPSFNTEKLMSDQVVLVPTNNTNPITILFSHQATPM